MYIDEFDGIAWAASQEGRARIVFRLIFIQQSLQKSNLQTTSNFDEQKIAHISSLIWTTFSTICRIFMLIFDGFDVFQIFNCHLQVIFP